MSSLQLRKDRLIIQIVTGPETQWMCTQQCLKHHYVLLDCLLISVLDVSAAFVSLLGTMYGPLRSAVDYAVKGGQTHFNPHGRVHACTHRRAHTHTHTHTQIKVIRVLCHITKPCVPPAFTNKGQNTATCLFPIGQEGRAHHSCGTTYLRLPCLFECFGEISSVRCPEHAAWNLTETNTGADGQTSETDTEGQAQTSYVCHGASPLAPCLL